MPQVASLPAARTSPVPRRTSCVSIRPVANLPALTQRSAVRDGELLGEADGDGSALGGLGDAGEDAEGVGVAGVAVAVAAGVAGVAAVGTGVAVAGGTVGTTVAQPASSTVAQTMAIALGITPSCGTPTL
jgi:hypothetical protein